MLYFTGVGSRDIPREYSVILQKIGLFLMKKGYILRSGGADGSDSDFEYAYKDSDNKEIYLPWKGFNGSDSNLILKDQKAFDLAKEIHPYWDNLNEASKKLQARNSYQVLGKDLKTPSDFLICYTKEGKEIGGTSQAIRLAKKNNIPILNIGKYSTEVALNEFMSFFNKNRKKKYYAFLGDKDYDDELEKNFSVISNFMEEQGYTLRTSGTKGINRVMINNTNDKEVMMPWHNFDGYKNGILIGNNYNEALDLSEIFLRNIRTLDDKIKKYYLNVSYIMYGENIKGDDEVEFLITYYNKNDRLGEIGQSIRMCEHMDIPILHLGDCKTIKEIQKTFLDFYKIMVNK